MAAYHAPKDPASAWTDKFLFRKPPFYVLLLFLMLGKGLAVDKQNPVEIATRRYLSPRNGT
jgi:hypothetical protein